MYVAAFGKAVLGMIRAVEDIVGDHIVRGVASVPFGIQETLLNNQLEHLIPTQDSKVEIFEGARYNLPDQDCVAATEKICEMTERYVTTSLFDASAMVATAITALYLESLGT